MNTCQILFLRLLVLYLTVRGLGFENPFFGLAGGPGEKYINLK
jgi:hypothetical protein